MFFVILLLICQALAVSGFYFITPDNLYMLFLWVPLGLLCGWILEVIILFVIIYPFLALTKPENRLKHELIYNFSWFVNRITRLKIKVIGKENIPQRGETFVCFANHKSMLDPFVIYEKLHRVMSAVAKNTLAKVGVINMFMKAFDVIPLDRENERQGVKDLLKAIKKVEGGYSYLIFPEGGIKTRETDTMENVKPGAFKLATKPEALILPVSLIGTSKCCKRAPFRKTKVTIVIHKPITFNDYKELAPNQIVENVTKIINDGVLNEKAY